ncbi:Probable transposable element [Penicillium roqueforti FM164]|uniref:Probable transposable element n=1 Tax=Penicillium roqueforti (strain FM164) TaxID=1365484 RepID=W6QJD1_PENRF|nr:hypothetical protein N7524_006183 [Penicillium chrysogenum]CDM36530.1 Probable transposable element [Penicillium roqueforti FM164]
MANIPQLQLLHDLLRYLSQLLKVQTNGRESATEKRHNRFILTGIEEGSIEKWLLDMDSRGVALNLPMLRDMANLLLYARKTTPTTVGNHWPAEFIRRRPNLSTRLSLKYDYQRALSEDP